MDVTNLIRFDEKAFTKLVIRDFLTQNFGRVNRMLEYCDLHDRFPLEAYAAALKQRLLARTFAREALPRDWETLTQGMPFLSRFPALTASVAGFLTTALKREGSGFSLEADFSLEVSSHDLVRGFLQLRYFMAEALDNFLPRTTALEFCKFDAIQFAEGKGKSCALVLRCRWHEALKEFGDPERAYAVACHYDFVAARRSGRNLHLTRSHTCVTSPDGCDFTWHDTRVSDMHHPDIRVWQEAKRRLNEDLEKDEVECHSPLEQRTGHIR